MRVNDVVLALSGHEKCLHGHACGGRLAAQHARTARTGKLGFAAKLSQLGHETENVPLRTSEAMRSDDVEHT
jgi:hypothetical protein